MLYTKVAKAQRWWCSNCDHELTKANVEAEHCPSCAGRGVKLLKAKDAAVCATCNEHVLTDKDRAAGRCLGCDTELPKPDAPKLHQKSVPLSESTKWLLTVQECRGAEGVREDVLANREQYAEHVASVVSGGTITKARSASAALDQAVRAIVAKSSRGVTYADALNGLMRTPAGRELYRQHQRQSAVEVV